MFINAEPILGVIDSYRLVHISGKFGGHKTALAFMIAKRYLDKGYSLVTNSRCIWADDYKKLEYDDNNQMRSVVLLDEGGLYFKSSKQIEQIAAYARKMDMIYLIPSFWPPAKGAQVINIQHTISLKATGLPVIVYKWTVNLGGFHEKGYFLWVHPREIYGIYSTKDPGDEPDEIIEWLIDKTEEYRTRFGRTTNNSLSKLEAISEGDKFIEAADIFEGAAESLEALSHRKGKRRR